MTNVELNKTLKNYQVVSEEVKALELKKEALKNAIKEVFEVRGVKKLETENYTAVLSEFTRESIMLKETLQEFGRDLLEAKNLINAYPVEVVKVTKK